MNNVANVADKTASNQVIVETFELSKHFRSGETVVKALDNVTLNLQRSSLVALRGPSGSGKSTLLNLLGALDKATSGIVKVDGVDVTRLSGGKEVAYRLKKVGFIFQSYCLIPNLTALENVMLPMELDGGSTDREPTARHALERVGIDVARQARRPARLSGGEQQRVAIARAMVNDPAIILADEPTGNLDSKTGRRIIELLQSLTKEGKTVIIATHSNEVATKADIVLDMLDGRIEKQFKPRQNTILSHPGR